MLWVIGDCCSKCRLIRFCCPVPFAETYSQSMRFPFPCCTTGMVLTFLCPPNTTSGVNTKTLILVPSEHITLTHASSASSKWSLAVLRRAYTRTDSNRGSFCAMHDFKTMTALCSTKGNLWNCGRSPIRVIDQLLSCSFLTISDTQRGEILHVAPVCIWLTVIFISLHFLTTALTVDLFFTKLLGSCPVSPCRLVEVFNCVLSVFWQLFGLAHGNIWTLSVGWICVFNKLN